MKISTATPRLAVERQVLDDRDVDHHQHREADGVGQQRGEPGEEQAPEGVARGDQLCVPRPMSCMMPFIFCAPWLTPIAKTRKGTRIEYGSSSKPKRRHQAQLPDHGHQRAGHHQRGRAQAARVEPDDRGGDQRREAEVQPAPASGRRSGRRPAWRSRSRACLRAAARLSTPASRIFSIARESAR